MNEVIEDLKIPNIERLKSGKVREVFNLGENLLLFATDRISAFDYILPTLIPKKGEILNRLSSFWFNRTNDIIENHFVTDNVDNYPESLVRYRHILEGRSMIVKKTVPIPIECVVRGYISGSAWNEYKKSNLVGGKKFDNLKESAKLPAPIFTPTTKAQTGHDEKITLQKVKDIVGTANAEIIKRKSIELYNFAHNYALKRGIIIADTKFEFGKLDDRIILIDEIFTPDSSRFWDLAQYEPGHSQHSFDKQFIRDYLLSTKWDRNSTPPELPREIVDKTVLRYKEALKRITG